MVRSAAAAVLLVAMVALTPGRSGEYNPKLSIGDAAPNWEGLIGTDDQKHALADYKDKELVILFFTSNSCIVATNYEDRIIDFAKRFAGPEQKVAMVAVNVNTIEEDRLPKMKEKAKEKQFPFPYLYDETQKIARDYGANFTPEFFVLDKDRKIAYMGALDDQAPPREAKSKHLEAAVEALLKGKKPPQTETSAASGCRIRFVRPKKP
jgi:peroxiredoxin